MLPYPNYTVLKFPKNVIGMMFAKQLQILGKLSKKHFVVSDKPTRNYCMVFSVMPNGATIIHLL